MARANTEADILSKYIRDEATGCCNWTGGRNQDGYPLVKWKGKTHLANRLIWQFRHGPIPEGMNVLHTCDNPGCIEDNHHFLGTHGDNRADCLAKGRQASGARHGRYTQPDRTARGIRHGSVTKPGSAPSGKDHWHYGKPAVALRGPSGRFIENGVVKGV